MRISLILFLFVLSTGITYARSYYDNGGIYSGSGFPQSVSQRVYGSNNKIKAPADLKKGTSSAVNIFGLVETGDASINAAARNGGIDKIYYVDNKINKVYIPLGFLPIYVKQKTTTVYGEEKTEEEEIVETVQEKTKITPAFPVFIFTDGEITTEEETEEITETKEITAEEENEEIKEIKEITETTEEEKEEENEEKIYDVNAM